jgi:hypothetical protein
MAAGSAAGWVCGVSVPMATCTVTGVLAVRLEQQAGAGARLGARANHHSAAPSASPMPMPFAVAAAAMARFISRPVSSAQPNRPSGSTASTSSLVWPASAISKSWMAAAPFSAKAVT